MCRTWRRNSSTGTALSSLTLSAREKSLIALAVAHAVHCPYCIDAYSEWKRELLRLHGIRFDALYCITNMPISRSLEWLSESANLERYMQRLVESLNPATMADVTCRSLISIGWDGTLYDCDLAVEQSAQRHIRDFDLAALARRRTSSDAIVSAARREPDRAAAGV